MESLGQRFHSQIPGLSILWSPTDLFRALIFLIDKLGLAACVKCLITSWYVCYLASWWARLLDSPSKDSLIMQGKLSWFNAVAPTLWTGYCWTVSIHSCSGHSNAKPLTWLKIILLLNSFPLTAILGTIRWSVLVEFRELTYSAADSLWLHSTAIFCFFGGGRWLILQLWGTVNRMNSGLETSGFCPPNYFCQ